jgi:hypothetical protein
LGRSDHSILVTLACFFPPVKLERVGPSPAFSYGITLTGDKTHERRELHLMEHVDVALCPIYMLILFLHVSFTPSAFGGKGERFPNPDTEWLDWLNKKLLTDEAVSVTDTNDQLHKMQRRAYRRQHRAVRLGLGE